MKEAEATRRNPIRAEMTMKGMVGMDEEIMTTKAMEVDTVTDGMKRNQNHTRTDVAMRTKVMRGGRNMNRMRIGTDTDIGQAGMVRKRKG